MSKDAANVKTAECLLCGVEVEMYGEGWAPTKYFAVPGRAGCNHAHLVLAASKDTEVGSFLGPDLYCPICGISQVLGICECQKTDTPPQTH